MFTSFLSGKMQGTAQIFNGPAADLHAFALIFTEQFTAALGDLQGMKMVFAEAGRPEGNKGGV